MSKGGSTNTIQSKTPPGYEIPYLKGTLQQAGGLYGTGGPSYYPGQQVAPFNPMQEQGLGDIQSAAQSNAPIQQAGSNYYTNLESGNYLSPQTNPYLQGLAGQSFNQIQNKLSSEFAGSGRNIEASAPVQADQMSQVANQIYGGQYGNTLNNMTKGLAVNNSLQQGAYIPGQMMLGAGGQVQNQAQNLIKADMNGYNYYQNQPYNNLSTMIQQISGTPSGTTTTAPIYQNKAASGLGGALAGASIANTLGYSGALGQGLGSGLGALLGFL